MASRPPGMASVIACEVDDVAAAVAHARDKAGFTPTIRAAARRAPAWPRSRRQSSGGLGLQLLQYV